MKTAADEPSGWAVFGLGFAFVICFALWAVGFDVLATALENTWIETVLNWLSRVWLWLAIAVGALALLFGRK